jgi:cellulose synthase/poly-beta-1,6-N-acetylglucosamine synthase-like glycosyltransferase
VADLALVGQLIALAAILAPDILIVIRARTATPCPSRQISDDDRLASGARIDVIVTAKVPEDERFVSDWPLAYKRAFSQGGGRLIISSNGLWSSQLSTAGSESIVTHTQGRGSKVENLEKSTSLVCSEIVAVFDSDARVEGVVRSATIVERLADADCIQGANISSSGSHSMVGRFCQHESLFSALVSETFSLGVHSTSQFRGTNAYFRAETFREVEFNLNTALEDIDATIRLLSKGRRIKFDPELVAVEASPSGPIALLKQRIRWFIGWGHLCRVHFFAVVKSSNMSLPRKCHVLGYLSWVTFVLPPAVAVVLTSDVYLQLLLAWVSVKFLTFEILAVAHKSSTRMALVFSVCRRLGSTGYIERLWFAMVAVLLEALRSVSVFGLIFGSRSNWEPTRKA